MLEGGMMSSKKQLQLVPIYPSMESKKLNEFGSLSEVKPKEKITRKLSEDKITIYKEEYLGYINRIQELELEKEKLQLQLSKVRKIARILQSSERRIIQGIRNNEY
jgi:hypothetical protein